MGMRPVPFPVGHPSISAAVVVVIVGIAVTVMTVAEARVAIVRVAHARKETEGRKETEADGAMVVAVVCFGGRSHGSHASPKGRSGGDYNKDFAEHDVTPSSQVSAVFKTI